MNAKSLLKVGFVCLLSASTLIACSKDNDNPAAKKFGKPTPAPQVEMSEQEVVAKKLDLNAQPTEGEKFVGEQVVAVSATLDLSQAACLKVRDALDCATPNKAAVDMLMKDGSTMNFKAEGFRAEDLMNGVELSQPEYVWAAKKMETTVATGQTVNYDSPTAKELVPNPSLKEEFSAWLKCTTADCSEIGLVLGWKDGIENKNKVFKTGFLFEKNNSSYVLSGAMNTEVQDLNQVKAEEQKKADELAAIQAKRARDAAHGIGPQ